MSARIGLLGGSFDPIHVGHLIVARSLAEQAPLDRVLLIPSPRPPHKTGRALTDAAHRLAMARAAVEDDPLFDVSDIELQRSGPSYTIDTIDAMRRRLGPGVALFWIIGADSLPELPTWHRVAELVQRVQFLTAARPDATSPDRDALASAVGAASAQKLLDHVYQTPLIQISATDIRRRVRAGLSIAYLTPPAVVSYIRTQGLYAT